MKKLVFVMPLLALSLLASCGGKPSPTPEEDAKFSADTTVTLDETKKIANITLDWTPTEHSVECSDFTFTLTNQPDIKSEITSGELGSRPLNLTITFNKALDTEDKGDLKFRYNDKTTKKEGEGKIAGINVKLPIDPPGPTKYTITYDYDGGQGSTEPSSYTIEDKVTLPTPTTLKTGYSAFGGWYFDATRTESAGTGWNAGQQEGSKDLYAKYTSPIQYDIEYVLNGGTSKGDNPDDYTIEDTITLKPAVGDQTFAGWHLQEDLKDTAITGWNPGDKIDKVFLYAEWNTTPPTPTEYTITYKNITSEETSGFATTYTSDDLPLTLSTPTRTDWTFNGYYTDETFTDTSKLTNNIIPVGTTGNLTLYTKMVYKTTVLENCSWAEIKTISELGGARATFGEIDGTQTKRVQLKHQDLDSDGVIDANEVCQTVRIIGYNHDKDTNGNPIGITFEFVDLISDAKGDSLAVQWFDTNDFYDYANCLYDISSIRRALNGTDDAWLFHWAEKDAEEWSKTYTTDDTVLSMLPDSLAKEEYGILKNPTKYVALSEDEGVTWKDESINDKLFLLSPREMGYDAEQQESKEHTSTYSYYSGHTSQVDLIRVKKHINGTTISKHSKIIPEGSGQYYLGYVENYAGYNDSSKPNGGGYYYLRSPYAAHEIGYACNVWSIGQDGCVDFCLYNVLHPVVSAVSIAPAFCI